MTSYEDERADMRGGAMEKILAKYAGDDSEEREAQRQRQARGRCHHHRRPRPPGYPPGYPPG